MLTIPIHEDSAASRARWLAELSGGLDRARELVDELKDSPDHAPEVDALRIRIAAAAIEVRALQLRAQRTLDRRIDRNWSMFSPNDNGAGALS